MSTGKVFVRPKLVMMRGQMEPAPVPRRAGVASMNRTEVPAQPTQADMKQGLVTGDLRWPAAAIDREGEYLPNDRHTKRLIHSGAVTVCKPPNAKAEAAKAAKE